MKTFRSLLRSPFAALAAGLGLAILSQTTQAQTTYTWLGNTDSNVNTAANWNPALSAPLTNDILSFGAAGTAGSILNYDRTTQTGQLLFGSGASAFSFSGTTVSLSGTGLIQNDSLSTQTFNNAISTGNGSFRANLGALDFNSVVTWGTNGTLTLSGMAGVTFAATAGGSVLTVGTSTSALLNVTGTVTTSASVANGGALNVGVGSSAGNGTVNIASGGLVSILGTTNSTKQNSLLGSSGGTGTVNVNGGALSVGANSGFVLGNGAGSTGALNVNSGTATITAGVYTSGSDRNFAVIMMGKDSSTASGTINLNGGVLATDRQFVRGRGNSTNANLGSAVFNFNGGTLRALADQSDWFSGITASGSYALTAMNVKAGGAIIDSNGFAVAINNVLSHDIGVTTDGGLAKTGAGSLTLGAANTYNGTTTITAGTLVLGAAGSISDSASIEINAGAVLDTTAQSTFVMLGDQPLEFTLDPAGSGSAGMLVAAGLNITSGVVDFSALGTLNDSVYILASYTALTGSNFATVNDLPSGYVVDYNYLGGNQIALVAVPEPRAFALLAAGLGCVAFRVRHRRGRREV